MNLLSVEDIMAYLSIHAIPFVRPGVNVQRTVAGAALQTVEAVAQTIKTQIPHIDVQVEENGRNTFTVTLVQL